MRTRAVAVLMVLCDPVHAACEDGHCRRYPRDRAVTHLFTLTVPCPSTGEAGHRCTDYIRDHFVPLCAGGADAAGNLWWEDEGRAADKDRHELQRCHRLRVIERSGDDPELRQRAMALHLRAVAAMGGEESARAERIRGPAE